MADSDCEGMHLDSVKGVRWSVPCRTPVKVSRRANSDAFPFLIGLWAVQ